MVLRLTRMHKLAMSLIHEYFKVYFLLNSIDEFKEISKYHQYICFQKNVCYCSKTYIPILQFDACILQSELYYEKR